MIALTGIGRRFHVAQQRIHFVRRQPPPGSHAAMARHTRCHCFKPVFQRPCAALGAQFRCQIFDQAFNIGIAEKGRRFPHRNRAVTEGFEHETEFGKFTGTLCQHIGVIRIECDDGRNEQPLRRDATIRQHPLQALVDEPLVRRVLIDDDEAIARLCHDVILMHLRTHRAERAIQQGLRKIREARTAIRTRLIESRKRRLRSFPEAGSEPPHALR